MGITIKQVFLKARNVFNTQDSHSETTPTDESNMQLQQQLQQQQQPQQPVKMSVPMTYPSAHQRHRSNTSQGHRQGNKLAYGKVRQKPTGSQRGEGRKPRSVIEYSQAYHVRHGHGEVRNTLHPPHPQTYRPTAVDTGIRDVPYHPSVVEGDHATVPYAMPSYPPPTSHGWPQQQAARVAFDHAPTPPPSRPVPAPVMVPHRGPNPGVPVAVSKSAPLPMINLSHVKTGLSQVNGPKTYANTVSMKNICNGNDDEALKLEYGTKRAGIVEKVSLLLNYIVMHNDKYRIPDNMVTRFHDEAIPTITIHQYIDRIARFSPCSNEALYAACMYLDRINRNYPRLLINSFNIHRFIITAVMLAGKYFDDYYYNNVYYARVGGVQAHEMNALEKDFLLLIRYDLHVEQPDYARYARHIEAFSRSYPYLPTLMPARAIGRFIDGMKAAVEEATKAVLAATSPRGSPTARLKHPLSPYHPHAHHFPSPISSSSRSSPPTPHAYGHIRGGGAVGTGPTPDGRHGSGGATHTAAAPSSAASSYAASIPSFDEDGVSRDSRWKFMV